MEIFYLFLFCVCLEIIIINKIRKPVKSYGANMTPRDRNDLRFLLWRDQSIAHEFLCHNGQRCDLESCDAEADPKCVEFYNSKIEL